MSRPLAEKCFRKSASVILGGKPLTKILDEAISSLRASSHEQEELDEGMFVVGKLEVAEPLLSYVVKGGREKNAGGSRQER